MNYSVSVVIPTYRRTLEIISRAVISVFKQKYPILEIIIVDDNNNDIPLSQSIESFCFCNNLKYIRSNGIGGAGARNYGVNAASGDFIAFLDDDDEWLSDKIKVQMELFKSPSIGLVYSRGYNSAIESDGTVSRSYYSTDRYYKTEVSYKDLLEKNYIGTTTQIIVRRDVIKKINGFDETLPSRQDYDLCLRIAKEYRCIGADKYLFIHHLHNMGQITSNPHTNMVGYQMILHKYRKDILHVNDSYRRFCYRIARYARIDKSYITFLKYMFLALLCKPLHVRETIKKCFDLK